jgi:hypothetical protein
MDEIDREENLIKFEKEKTELKKERFIKQIRGGLGDYIKNNGNKIVFKKKSPLKRFLHKLMEIF